MRLRQLFEEQARVRVAHEQRRERRHERGPSQRHDSERSPREVPQRRVEEPHARQIRGVRVVDDEHDRPRGELRAEELLPRAHREVREQDGACRRRRAVLRAAVYERGPHGLAEHRRRLPDRVRVHVSAHAVAQLFSALRERLVRPDLRQPVQHVAERPERQRPAVGVAVPPPDSGAERARDAGDLRGEPGLPDARGPRDHGAARDGA